MPSAAPAAPDQLRSLGWKIHSRCFSSSVVQPTSASSSAVVAPASAVVDGRGHDGGVAAQGAQHGLAAITFDGDGGQRPDAVLLGLRLQAHGVAGDGAGGFELGQPVLHCSTRHLQLLGQRGDRRAGVAAQQGNQLMVGIVHDLNAIFV